MLCFADVRSCVVCTDGCWCCSLYSALLFQLVCRYYCWFNCESTTTMRGFTRTQGNCLYSSVFRNVRRILVRGVNAALLPEAKKISKI